MRDEICSDPEVRVRAALKFGWLKYKNQKVLNLVHFWSSQKKKKKRNNFAERQRLCYQTQLLLVSTALLDLLFYIFTFR